MTTHQVQEKATLSLGEAVAYLAANGHDIGESTLRVRAQRGQIYGQKRDAQTWVFDENELDRYLNEELTAISPSSLRFWI